MKKLNNKGFTLIELLAVIVILAIVMGISATGILNSINNSRKSSLLSAAQTYASNINTWATEDALVQTDDSRKLGDAFEKLIKVTNAGKWVCLNAAGNIKNGGTSTSLVNALGVSATDVFLTGKNPVQGTGNSAAIVVKASDANENNDTCSAIRYSRSAGAYEILLVAKTGGKYYVTTEGDKNFAFSRATTFGSSSGILVND